MADKAPAFQFYPKDYLSDAKIRAMTFKQRGMYWTLVCHCWIEQGLPADPKEIARILGIPTPARFEQHDWPAIGRCFYLKEGTYQHGRLDIERRKQDEYREAGRLAGIASGESRRRRANERPFNDRSTDREPNGNSSSPSAICNEDQDQNKAAHTARRDTLSVEKLLKTEALCRD